MKIILKTQMAVLLAILLCFSNTSYINAMEKPVDSCKVTYSMDGDTVIEKTEWIEYANMVSYRYVYPDGSGLLKMCVDNIEKTAFLSNMNYDLFLSWVQHAPTVCEDENETHISTLNDDVTGSQYKHVYISSHTETYSNAALKYWSSFSETYWELSLGFGDLPSMVLSSLARLAVDVVGRNTPEKLDVRVYYYEVRFSFDDGYYCHCYHMQCQSTNPNASYWDYQQTIGG